MDEAVKISDDIIKLYRNGHLLDSCQVNDIVSVNKSSYVALIPDEYEIFVCIEFYDRFWIIPTDLENITSLEEFLFTHQKFLLGKYNLSNVDIMPWSWRKRLFGLIPLFPEPRLCVLPIDKLPIWINLRAVTPEEFKNYIRL